jgi:hypothetical protein
MSVRSRKTLITSAHSEIGQGEFADRHDLVFAVIQLVHRSLLSCKILQSAQQISLFATVPFPFGMFFVTLVQDLRNALPQLLHLTGRRCLEPVAFGFPLSRGDSLRLELLQLFIQDSIALFSFGFCFFPEACIAQRSSA